MYMTRKRNGLYLLPHLLTSVSLSCGFYDNPHIKQAAVAILIAMIFDVLDGKVARAMGVASDFGKAFDSLSDMVTFGVAPAVWMHHACLLDLGRVGFMAALSYVVATALRLARYNSQEDSNVFCGLPSPAAAALVAGSVWVMPKLPGQVEPWMAALWIVLSAILMISRAYKASKGTP